ncbi:diguanylate cyclase domain-containing protein [Paraburkholderia hiiakae]|uniref:diguanylate cyclase domain-containing protein n=1 Tax=Paraburkholderia hiiakae TaxID=1081782 RepID=UPI001F47EEA7|nr:diguanylate cyclase [Paraburkholderia hiiakae]
MLFRKWPSTSGRGCRYNGAAKTRGEAPPTIEVVLTRQSVSQQPVRLAQETGPDVSRLQTILRRSRPAGTERGDVPRWALILLPALTVLILAVLWVTILERLRLEKDAALNNARVAAGTAASALATHTLKTIHDVDEIALLIKFGYENSPTTFDLKKYQSYGLVTADTALQVTVVGANGRVIVSTIPFSGEVDLSDREHFRMHRERADVGLYLSQPVVGRISHQTSVQATRRINRPDGSFGGVVVVSENPAWLTDGFYSAALGEHGMIAVLSRRGFMLSRRAGDAPSRTGDASPSGYLGVRTAIGASPDPIDHVERIVSTREIKQYGLTVVAGLSVAEALDDYWRMRRVYLTMATVISVILVGLSTWITALILELLRGKEALRQLAHTDALTGLSNRARIMDLLAAVIVRPGAAGRVAVIFVDLDRFKELNDTFGHHLGDAILGEIARRLTDATQGRARIGRLGGDEFLVIVEDDCARDAASQIATGITAALEAPFDVHGRNYSVRASLGVAVLQPGERASDLVKTADRAMYDAKERNRVNRVPSMPGALAA